MTVNAPRYVLAAPPVSVKLKRVGVLVIGAGAAGLTAALAAAARADVLVLARGPLPESNSAMAQGGIAAALDAADSPGAHIADTLVAGAGLSDEAAVAALAYEAPALMRDLAARGVPFEREDEARFSLGLEGGHSARRIVHVGDATGWAVTRALIDEARAHPRIALLEGWQAADLLDAGGRVGGALARDPEGGWWRLLAGATIIASGGAGALYGLTSNQPTALGEGIAMAYRAGAEVADMEFVQFHPTVYRTRGGQGFLITEAARGEGGVLRTPDGARFMPAYDPRAELAPRDVVTRGIYAAMRAAKSDHVLLDLSHLPRERVERHFPTICARLREEGLDPATTPIPVAPAAHYLMGGIRTDLDGATSVPGLFAAGEVACTGVHGANRLASNSLLECLVFGRRAGEAAVQQDQGPKTKDPSRAEPPGWPEAGDPCMSERPGPGPSPVVFGLHWREELAATMRAAAGPLRDGAGLRAGLGALESWPVQADADDAEGLTAANAALVARLVVAAALLREESRGGHFRADFPQQREGWRAHSVLARGREPAAAEHLAPAPAMAHAAD
ncbi:MAG TPA: L-aspartate oxidase [Chloroflexaceae bacterium]|nr:L-aspartate oxidase [Chloroflexaceae bacterium]